MESVSTALVNLGGVGLLSAALLLLHREAITAFRQELKETITAFREELTLERSANREALIQERAERTLAGDRIEKTLERNHEEVMCRIQRIEGRWDK